MSRIKPAQTPAREQAQQLLDAANLLLTVTVLPYNWGRVIAQAWGRSRASIINQTTSQNGALGSVALQLSRGGANACSRMASETTDWPKYQWLVAGRAHRMAAAAIIVGWPPTRYVPRPSVLEFASLRARNIKPMISEAGNQGLQALLQDPLGLQTGSEVFAIMETIAANAHLDGPQ